MKLYKLTDENGCTYGGVQWGEGVEHEATGYGGLCTSGLIHAYEDQLVAVLMNPIGAGFKAPRMWEAEGDICEREGQLKCGCKKLLTIREIPLPQVTVEQKVRFAIYCALAVCDEKSFVGWANNWLNNRDRSEAAAQAAWVAADATRASARATGGAARAAWAAWLAAAEEGEASARAAQAAARAAKAAQAAKAARASSTVNIIELAHKAVREEVVQSKMPAWAKEERYEYDLGMATCCEFCGEPLKEGQVVWRDLERHSYQAVGDLNPVYLPTAYYCSVACVMGVDL